MFLTAYRAHSHLYGAILLQDASVEVIPQGPIYENLEPSPDPRGSDLPHIPLKRYFFVVAPLAIIAGAKSRTYECRYSFLQVW